MGRLVLLFFVTSLAALAGGKISEELLVRLDHGGGVTGYFSISHSGRGYLAFPNIPYAEPPVGQLRFQDPVKKAPWQGYLPTNRGTIKCPRKEIYMRAQQMTGVEDCLYLNVFVPHSTLGRRDIPVMVFIHGGSFTIGSGAVQMHSPEMIMDRDVILVTANYRLGPLGFLSTLSDPLSGNWGLKDQQLMLNWVQDNIHSFGGDKRQVTIFGVSAGGASVGLHMMSPKSSGLFQRAIPQSGTPYDQWVIQDKDYAIAKAMKLIKLVGCGSVDDDSTELLKCLQKLPVKDIFEPIYEFFEFDMDPLIPFGPVLESNEVKNPFIQEKDMKEIVNPVPMLIGITQDEGAFRSAVLNGDKELTSTMGGNFSEIIPAVLCYSHYEDGVKGRLTKEIQKFYFKGGPFEWEKDKHTYNTMLGDGLFIHGFDQFIHKRNLKSKDTFAYLFNYRGRSSFTDCITNYDEYINWGVSHAEDMMYTFAMLKRMAPHRTHTDRDLQVAMDFVRMLTDFATYGDPAHSIEGLTWNSVTDKHFNYMRIGNCNRIYCPTGEERETKMEKDPFPDRINFWREMREIRRPYWEKESSKEEL